jgi:hypothetical protein
MFSDEYLNLNSGTKKSRWARVLSVSSHFILDIFPLTSRATLMVDGAVERGRTHPWADCACRTRVTGESVSFQDSENMQQCYLKHVKLKRLSDALTLCFLISLQASRNSEVASSTLKCLRR